MNFSIIRTHKLQPFAFVLAASIALLGAACSAPQQQESASEAAAPAEQITPADVEAFEVRLLKGSDGKGFHVEGQIRNNSPKLTLKEFEFQMVMQDCLPTGVCEEIAKDTATIAANVPAGQAAPFEADPDFSNMPEPKGQLGWHYAVVATTAATP